MTQAEALKCVALIRRAFPGMKMEQRFYIRGLLKYEAEPAKLAILGAIEDEWRFPPSVYELMETLRRTRPQQQVTTCHHGVSFFDSCQKCVDEA